MTDDGPKRELLAVEGVRTGDGRLLRPGSLVWEEPIRILHRAPGDPDEESWGLEIYGAGIDVHREDDGRITVTCVPELPEGATLAIDLMDLDYVPVDEDDLDAGIDFVHGRIYSALIIPALRSPWPDHQT